MVTQRVTIEGRTGVAVFLTATLAPATSRATAEVVKVIFDDHQSVLFGVRKKKQGAS